MGREFSVSFGPMGENALLSMLRTASAASAWVQPTEQSRAGEGRSGFGPPQRHDSKGIFGFVGASLCGLIGLRGKKGGGGLRDVARCNHL